jgi:UDP:flavonoid glycosyltransferase YjiC (YdhE family)
MAKVMLAWELGGNYGHLVALRALARELKRQGHSSTFAVRSLGSAQGFLDPALGPLVQAPVRLTQGRNRVRTQLSYASLLHNIGFNDPLELAGRIHAWRTLYRALGTEFVFADHSPVALVAARTLGIPAACIGNGFTVPPRQSPFPSFRVGAAPFDTRPSGATQDRRGRDVPQQVLLANEAAVLRELNHALALLKLRPFALLQDIFRSASTALLTYAPLDHYDVPRAESFRGLPDYSYGAPPQWPSGKGPRIFAYLTPNASLPVVLKALRQSKARVLVRLVGGSAEDGAPALRPGLSVTTSPVHFRAAAESCDAFVNYGAHSTVAEFLLAGKPGILVPDLHERVLTARRAAGMGAAVSVRATSVAPVARALEQVIDDPQPRKAAAAFAGGHGRQDRAAILPGLVEDLL